jgi:hypothetical protein
VNPKEKEGTLHQLLERHFGRVHPRREFFRCSAEDVRTFFKLLDGVWWEPSEPPQAASPPAEDIDMSSEEEEDAVGPRRPVRLIREGVLRHGERFVCLPKQGLPLVLPSPPTAEQLAESSGVCVVNGPQRGFLLSDSSYHANPTSACKALLNRSGRTNEWNGPRHLFVERDGAWISYKQLSS